MKKLIITATTLVAGLFLAGTALAVAPPGGPGNGPGSLNTDIPVSVIVDNSTCSSFTNSGGLDFGHYHPTQTRESEDRTTISYTCSINMPVTISFKSLESNMIGKTKPYMVIDTHPDTPEDYELLQYKICSEKFSSGECPDGSNLNTNNITDIGGGLKNDAKTATVYGAVKSGQYSQSGSYEDMLEATLTW